VLASVPSLGEGVSANLFKFSRRSPPALNQHAQQTTSTAGKVLRSHGQRAVNQTPETPRTTETSLSYNGIVLA
jgi:hypothetical protein